MKYRAEIDGLRALAVVPVILFHAGFKVFSGGYIGVDIFFVISGYLITTILLVERTNGTFSIVQFYERRARRILPALFFVMLACLPFAWLWLLPEDMKSFSQSLIAVPAFVSNFLFWKTSGYFDIAAELKPLLHTWSLAVEEQYYLLFPPLLMFAWRFGRRVVLTLMLLLFVCSLLLAQWASVAQPDAAYYLLLTRGWEMMVGSLVAFFISRSGALIAGPKIRQVGSFAGLALIFYSIFAFDSQTPFPGVYALAPTLGAALVIFYADAATFTGRLLGSRWLVGVGLVSYSAYLWHQPLLVFARHRSFEGVSINTTVVVLLLTALLAYCSWKYVETPFRSRDRFSRKQIFSLGALFTIIFMAIGAAGHMTKGFAERFVFVSAYEGDIGQADFYKYLDGRYYLCKPKSIADDPENKVTFRCLQSKAEADIDIALIGDSHAEHLFLGIAESLNSKNVLIHAKPSYPSIDSPAFKEIFRYVLDTPSINSVIISAHWISKIDHVPKNTTLEQELGKTIDALLRVNKRVYLFGDVPLFPFPPERCKYMAESLGRSVCSVPKDHILEKEKGYRYALEAVARQRPSLQYLEPRDQFCDMDRCSMVKGGVLMYRDNNHLNIPGSRFIGRTVVDQFPALKD